MAQFGSVAYSLNEIAERVAEASLAKTRLPIVSLIMLGMLAVAGFVFLSGHLAMNDGAIGKTYLDISAVKTSLPFWNAFFSGVMCNVLVCLAVWMTLAG